MILVIRFIFSQPGCHGNLAGTHLAELEGLRDLISLAREGVSLAVGSALVMLWYFRPWRSATTRALRSEAGDAGAMVAAAAPEVGLSDATGRRLLVTDSLHARQGSPSIA